MILSPDSTLGPVSGSCGVPSVWNQPTVPLPWGAAGSSLSPVQGSPGIGGGTKGPSLAWVAVTSLGYC